MEIKECLVHARKKKKKGRARKPRRAGLVQVEMQSQANRSSGRAAFASASRSPRWWRRRRKRRREFFFCNSTSVGGTLSFPGSHSWRRAASEKSKKIPPKILVPRKQAIGKRHVALRPLPLMHRLLARTGRHASTAQRKTAVRNSAAL